MQVCEPCPCYSIGGAYTGLRTTENSVTKEKDMLSSCNWDQWRRDNFEYHGNKNGRGQDSGKERSHTWIGTHWHETQSSQFCNAAEEERPGFEAGLDEWCSQSYRAKGSLPSRKHGLFLMFLIQRARRDKLKLRT